MTTRTPALVALLALSLLAMLLSGCATCERHPAVCAAGVAVLATSLAMSVNHGGHAGAPSAATPTVSTQPITCTGVCAQ